MLLYTAVYEELYTTTISGYFHRPFLVLWQQNFLRTYLKYVSWILRERSLIKVWFLSLLLYHDTLTCCAHILLLVTRVVGKGVSYELELTLDINSEVWRLKKNDKFTFALVSTLDLEGKPDDGIYNQSGKVCHAITLCKHRRILIWLLQATLLDRYDYGMYGKIFQYEHEGGNNVAIYASFGGLLMRLRGEQRHLHLVHNDSRIYCLLRKQ